MFNYTYFQTTGANKLIAWWSFVNNHKNSKKKQSWVTFWKLFCCKNWIQLINEVKNWFCIRFCWFHGTFFFVERSEEIVKENTFNTLLGIE